MSSMSIMCLEAHTDFDSILQYDLLSLIVCIPPEAKVPRPNTLTHTHTCTKVDLNLCKSSMYNFMIYYLTNEYIFRRNNRSKTYHSFRNTHTSHAHPHITCTHTHHMHTHVHIHIVHAHTHIHTHITCTPTHHMHTHIHTHITCTPTHHMHTHTYTHTHTCIHTVCIRHTHTCTRM